MAFCFPLNVLHILHDVEYITLCLTCVCATHDDPCDVNIVATLTVMNIYEMEAVTRETLTLAVQPCKQFQH